VFLVAMGLLIMFGRFQQLNGWLLSAGSQVERWASANPKPATAIFGVAPIVLALLIPLVRRLRGKRLRPGTFGLVMAVLLAAAGALHLTGVINLAGLVAGWLQYQGV
jgi:chromate transport protein ChrA